MKNMLAIFSISEKRRAAKSVLYVSLIDRAREEESKMCVCLFADDGCVEEKKGWKERTW